MKKLVLALAALPFVAGAAFAGDRLSNAEMDGITAGALFSIAGFGIPGITGISCPASSCTTAISTSTSNNGVTVNTSSTTGPGTGSSGSSGGSGLPSAFTFN
jgi:hypothetical protein